VETFHWGALALQIAMGFSLASCTGLRAFLPLLVAGATARLGWFQLGEGFTWLSSNEALVLLTAAAVLELLGDKVAVVDHLLDAGGNIIKPVAGCLAAAAPLLELDAGWAILIGLITGATTSEIVHLGKSQIRWVSTLTTGGVANPLVSLGEDVLTALGSILALVLPILAALAVAAALWVGFRGRRGLKRSRDPSAPWK
jgi:Domain of unknown function (DUF4126)